MAFLGLADLGLDLELEVSDVLGDLLGALLVDPLDDVADDAYRVTRRCDGLVPTHALEVHLALDEPAVQGVDDLVGNELGRRAHRDGGIGLGKLDARARALEVIALGELAGRLLDRVVNLQHVNRGDDVEARPRSWRRLGPSPRW